jgi:hypothetical protein
MFPFPERSASENPLPNAHLNEWQPLATLPGFQLVVVRSGEGTEAER